MKTQLINLLEEYVTEHKKDRINAVLSERTRHLTVVLEDLYDPHNISAVIRTCDCFGIQDLYITQLLHEYVVNPNIVRGASKWVTLNKYELNQKSTETCLKDLKKNGYRLVGTTPDPNSTSIQSLDITQPTALIFGTELKGMSDFAKRQVDEMVHIPMYGFTESFNISVSAALILQQLVQRLKSSSIKWGLHEEEKSELKFEWYQRVVKNSDLHIKNYLQRQVPDSTTSEN